MEISRLGLKMQQISGTNFLGLILIQTSIRELVRSPLTESFLLTEKEVSGMGHMRWVVSRLGITIMRETWTLDPENNVMNVDNTVIRVPLPKN